MKKILIFFIISTISICTNLIIQTSEPTNSLNRRTSNLQRISHSNTTSGRNPIASATVITMPQNLSPITTQNNNKECSCSTQKICLASWVLISIGLVGTMLIQQGLIEANLTRILDAIPKVTIPEVSISPVTLPDATLPIPLPPVTSINLLSDIIQDTTLPLNTGSELTLLTTQTTVSTDTTATMDPTTTLFVPDPSTLL